MARTSIKDRVQYNVTGQTLTFDCPQGRPSADGTVTLYDGRYDPDDTTNNPIVTGTATRTAIDIAMNGAAGPDESNPRNIPVAAADMTSIASAIKVGQLLWLTSASKEKEQIEVAKYGSTSIGALDPLAYTYASGADVESAEVTSPAITAAWIQDEDNIGSDYYAVWVYVVGGITYRSRSYFDVVREVVETALREVDIADGFPDFMRVVAARERTGYIRDARRDVDMLFRLRGFNPNRIRGTESYQWLERKLVPLKAAQNGRKPNGMSATEYLAVAEREYNLAATQFLEGKLPVPYDVTEDDVFDGERDACAVSLIK